MSIFENYPDLQRPEFVENYDFFTCPTVTGDGMVLDLDVAAALLRTDGNLSETARVLQRSRRVIETYIQRNPQLSELVDDIVEAFVDDAEAKARVLARGGDGGMIKFMLSTIGKKRGYVTRVEATGKDGSQLTVNFYLPDNGREMKVVEHNDG